jgi:hypothetical protein
MRVLAVVVAVVQAVMVVALAYQLLADQQRPPDQRTFPRRLPLFVCVFTATAALNFVLAFRLGR